MLKRSKLAELQDILDSDDELPTNYNEKPDLPAYLDDQRFDAIHFNWIKNNTTRSVPVKQAPVPICITENHRKGYSHVAKQNGKQKNLIKKGILNEQDIFCMKSVAARTNDEAALLWFIDFLMYKDLQSDYKFLKSCLVFNQENYGNSRKQYSQIFHPKSLSNCFEVIVK